MKVALILDWYLDKERQDSFWKVVEMPALPHVGCDVFIQGDGRGIDGIVAVRSILWCESRPDVFEVEIGEIHESSKFRDHEEFIVGMQQNGWLYEATHPFAETYASKPPAPQ